MKRRYFTKNNKTFIECKDYHNTRVFEVVEEFPQGYIMWLVPYDYPDTGYIALAKPSNIDYNVVTDNLKCLYVGEELQKKLHKYGHNGNDIDATNFNDIVKQLKTIKDYGKEE